MQVLVTGTEKNEKNDIDTMTYRQLQEMCKKIGINARQKVTTIHSLVRLMS
jgi:hypothetical protein